MKIHILFSQFLAACFVVTGCVPSLTIGVSPTLKPPNEYTQAYDPLKDGIADALVEVTLLTSPSLSSPLLRVGYIFEENVIVGIYSDGGTITGWNTEKATVAFTHKFGIATSKALVLIASGNNLIGATEHNFKSNGMNQDFEYVNGIALWDVRTGALIKCITFPCQETPVPGDGFLGLSIDRDGEWIAIFSESGISLSGLPENSPSLYYTINDLDASYQWSIGSVVFDEKNRRYAVIFQEGRIYISDGELSVNYRVLVRGTKNDRIAITDAQIDPTGRWLVIARGEKTQVLNLDNGKSIIDITISNPVLSFDRTGELLFVGSANKMTIYSIKTSEKIAEYDTVGITSLAISEDNRLVIWGDAQGAIHIWGKPLPAQ